MLALVLESVELGKVWVDELKSEVVGDELEELEEVEDDEVGVVVVAVVVIVEIVESGVVDVEVKLTPELCPAVVVGCDGDVV